MIDASDVIAVQGETESGHEFGYIRAGSGGFFFTWRYGEDRTPGQRIDQICDTIEADATDLPTGRGDLRQQAERALRSYIERHGIRRIPSSSR